MFFYMAGDILTPSE